MNYWNPKVPTYVRFVESQDNPNLYDYTLLTGFYFAGPNRIVDPEIFKNRYLETELRLKRDSNHPELYSYSVMNLEFARTDLVDSDTWLLDTERYLNVANMMRAYGKPVTMYGIGPGNTEFQGHWRVGRFKELLSDRNLNERTRAVYQRYVDQGERWLGIADYKLEKLAKRFGQSIDHVCLSLYAPYEIPSVDSWQMRAYKYYIDQSVSRRKELYPCKPIHVFIQSAVTSHRFPDGRVGFKAMEPDVWSEVLRHTTDHDEIQGVMVFAISTIPTATNLEKTLLYGPYA